jgi:opacity protein-like surface antigen
MRSVCTLPLRKAAVVMLALGGLLIGAAPVSAQGFGIGARFSWDTREVDVEDDTVRLFGGQLRILSQRFGVELSLDRRSEELELLNQKVTETPIQASFLLRLASGSVSPFVLGGPGWYRRSVEPLVGDDDEGVSETEFGWHAGVGLEVLAGRHFGIHGDYRYTFLDFGDDDDDEGFIGGLLPGHRGSMWTLGATVYF